MVMQASTDRMPIDDPAAYLGWALRRAEDFDPEAVLEYTRTLRWAVAERDHLHDKLAEADAARHVLREQVTHLKRNRALVGQLTEALNWALPYAAKYAPRLSQCCGATQRLNAEGVCGRCWNDTRFSNPDLDDAQAALDAAKQAQHG